MIKLVVDFLNNYKVKKLRLTLPFVDGTKGHLGRTQNAKDRYNGRKQICLLVSRPQGGFPLTIVHDWCILYNAESSVISLALMNSLIIRSCFRNV